MNSVAAAVAGVAAVAGITSTAGTTTSTAGTTTSTAGTTTSTASIEESFHINTLLNYLPILVLVVILLIGFVSWDVMKGNWSIFVTLIIAFIFVVYIHYLNPDKFLTFKDGPNTPFFPKPSGTVFDIFSNQLLYILLPIGIFILGVSLGYGSIALSRAKDTYDPSVGLITIGSILIGGAGISLFMLALKKFANYAFIQNIPLNTLIGLFVLCTVSGVPMVVRGNEIKDELGVKLKDDEFQSKKLRENLADTGADTMLGIGVFFQIAVFIALGYYIWSNTHDTNGKFGGTRSKLLLLIVIFIFMPGGVFLSKSLRGPGFDSTNTAEIGSFENKPFLVHGIIWLIAGIILCLVLFGQTSQFIVHRYSMYIILAIFVCFIIVSSVKTAEDIEIPTVDTVLSNDRDYMNSGYYQQLRAEVIKDLKQKDPNAVFVNDSDPSKDSQVVKDAITIRLDEIRKKTQDPTGIVFGVFASLSVIITVFILMCYNVRLKMAECGYIPDSFDWPGTFLHSVKGECENDNFVRARYYHLSQEYKEKVKQDKMLSKDWDNILSKHEMNDENERNNEDETNDLTTDKKDFSIWFVRFAKWFSFIPFLSVILIVMWVSILFTSVTTSPKTSDWIASKFTGDMFPRVKELIDAFFIVIIVGLLLCAILLLPIVKEMNAGGLESILKFTQSIQVWQYNNVGDPNWINWGLAIFGFLLIFSAGLSWWWVYLTQTKPAEEAKIGGSLPIVPDNWGWAIAFVVLLAICVMPSFFNMYGDNPRVNADFEKENVFKRVIRQILTTIYLVPLLFAVLFRAGVYGVASLTGIPEFVTKRENAMDTLKFWNWDANKTDLRMFPTDDEPPNPASVTSVPAAAAAAAAAATASINETKVSAIGKLIKVILLTISLVILILAIIYYVYKIDSEFSNKSDGADATASGGFAAQLNSPTAHTIYVLIAIVGIAGLVAHLREKFTKANSKTPENYLFDDLKTEDATSPLRQLAFGATHIIYVILMVVVWIYDRDKDDKNRMSVTGMTILGLAILFFHYGLEFIDTFNPNKNSVAGGPDVTKPSVADLFSNIRFIINTIFFIVLCALAYYKQHGVMVVLILAMFIFHLTKSIIGLKLLKLLWLGIIFIPCLFLDFLQSSQITVGDTTRPIWIIVAIEVLLITILYGGPYLLNYIGASASQIVAAPVSLKEKYDTNLTTQSPQIFIYHNTGIDRTPEDKAANCPAEEKKRYNYSISGWFILNNTVDAPNGDLEIFNFGDVPRLTYNSTTTELKLFCNTLDMSGNPNTDAKMIYNSRTNYNTMISGKTKDKRARIKMLVDDEELDTPVPLQKWNYFVVNYNGKTMDFFLNTKLIIKSDFIMPDIQLKPITVGYGDAIKKVKGLNGSICNFAFHKVPLTKEQIRWTYNMLKSQNPPMIGMKTIEDEVKAAGSTTMYAK